MTDSELLSRDECRRLFDIAWTAARRAGAQELEILAGATGGALTRFANNAIHQNVAEQKRHLSVRALLDHRTARVNTNRLDEASVRTAVEEAVAIARAVEPDPEMLPVADPADYREVDRFCRSTATSGPRDRAEVVRDAIAIVEEAGQTAAGIYSAAQSVEAILNSRGLFGYYNDTLAQFSITAMGGDSSGWAKASAPDCGSFDPLELARRASGKAAVSRAPRGLPAGRYTVILEPSAVSDLVGQMFFDFSATAIHDQRSFLTGRIGTKLFGDAISIADDAYHPLQAGPPFDGEGVPRRVLALVENGVVRDIAYSRQAAARDGAAATGHGFPVPNEIGEAPLNIVMRGGDQTIEQMIAATDRGILVTRLWYIREVDPYEKIMTGLTRDGTFLIEGGQVACGLKNFRFNQSLPELLRNVDVMSPAVRSSGEEAFDMVVPAMMAREFNFVEVTKF